MMSQACKSSAALLVRVPAGKSEGFSAGWAKADLHIKTHGRRPDVVPALASEEHQSGYVARLLEQDAFGGVHQVSNLQVQPMEAR